jgi:hypothetical protein
MNPATLQALKMVPASMQGMEKPGLVLLSAATTSLRWSALRKVKPLRVMRTCATLSSRVPLNLMELPASSFVLKAPPHDDAQPPPVEPEQPTATSAATRASRARLRRGRDSSVDGMRGRPPVDHARGTSAHPSGGKGPTRSVE